MKKIFKTMLCIALGITLFGCSNQKKDLTLDEMIDAVYEGIPEDKLPMMIEAFPIDEENEEWFLGTDTIDYKKAIASESAVGSIPHSVVLVETESEKETESVKKELKESINGYKWVCVGVLDKDIVIESQENIIIVIIDGFNLAPSILDNFNNLF